MEYFHYTNDKYKYNLLGNGEAILDIPYSDISEKNKLDIYIPTHGQKPYPLIVYIHGGAFCRGDKTHHISGILHGLERGYAVACINYRLNQEAPYPAFLEDVCEGIRFLKSNADKYAIDKNKFALWGDTHGGYIASTIAIMGPKKMLDNLQTNFPKESLNVCGVISFYAPIDLADYYKYQLKTNNIMVDQNGNPLDEMTFGKQKEELIDFLKPLNPLLYVNGTEPPFYLLHGELDPYILRKYSQEFANVLTKHLVPHVFNFVKGGEHAIDTYDNLADNDSLLSFLDYVFRKEK